MTKCHKGVVKMPKSTFFNLSPEKREKIEKAIENEFGRTISSMECQIIKSWIDDNFSHELIMEALKEAIYNGVTSLRYIEKILYDWRKKGYKNKQDVIAAKKKYQDSKKEVKDVFYYDWLNDD